jgi:hypothetical protein
LGSSDCLSNSIQHPGDLGRYRHGSHDWVLNDEALTSSSRDTLEHELNRQKQSGSEAPRGEAKRARDDLQDQVKEEIELPERGSA